MNKNTLIITIWIIAPIVAIFIFIANWIQLGTPVHGDGFLWQETLISHVLNGAYIYRYILDILGLVTVMLLIVILIFRVLTGRFYNPISTMHTWDKCFVFLFAWIILSTILSDDPNFQFYPFDIMYEGGFHYLVWGAILLISSKITDDSFKGKTYLLFVFIADILSLISLGQLWRLPYIRDIFYPASTAIFYNSNHFAYYLTMTVMLSAGVFLYNDKKSIRRMAILSFSLQVYALLLNDTFGCYLAVLFALPVMYIFYKKSGHVIDYDTIPPMMIFAALSIVNSTGFLPGSNGMWGSNFTQMASDLYDIAEWNENALYGGSGRIILWVEALKRIPEHPIFGTGPEGLIGEYTYICGNNHVHNEYLSYAVYFGLPALAAYLVGLWSLFKDRYKKIATLDPVTIISAGAVVAYLASAFFGNAKYYTAPYYFILLGFVAASTKTDKTPVK